MNIESLKSEPAQLNLRWLARLRWLSAAVELALLAAAYFAPLRTSAAQLALLGVLIILTNGVGALALRRRFLPMPSFIGALLLVDTLIITLLLAWTGGPYNPFTILYLVQISFAAVALRPIWTWLLTLCSSVGFYSLFVISPAEAVHALPHQDSFSLHLYGMLVAFVFTAVLVSFMLSKLAAALLRSERRLSEMHIDRLNEQRLASLATLAAGAAHELSTPLTTIALAKSELCELAADEPISQSAVLNAADSIGVQVRRCKGILADMAGRSGALRGDALQDVLLAECIAEAVAGLRNRRAVEISVDIASSIATVTGVYEPLRQVLASLLQNAVDACSDDAGRVTLRVRDNGAEAVISIKDNGHGMDAELLAAAKEPFFTTKPVGSGMGLGLFLAELYAKQFGGSLSLASIPGEGTTARLVLPKTARPEEIASHA